jgi:hypothetical protein
MRKERQQLTCHPRQTRHRDIQNVKFHMHYTIKTTVDAARQDLSN